MCMPKISSRRATYCIWSTRRRYGLARDALPLEEAERMRARRADAHALLARDRDHVAANAAQLVGDLAGRVQTGVAISSTDCISSG
jgi:hypothetical protein